jgi:hypothetical protein
MNRARNLGLIAGLGLGLLGGASVAVATDVVNLGAARVAGTAGSDWHDRQLVKDKGEGSSFRVYVTPRGQVFSDTDGFLEIVLQPGETRMIEDLFEQVYGTAGAGTIRIVPDEGSPAPVWRSIVYNRDGEAEFGMTSRPFNEEADQYYSNATLGTMLSPDGFRDNIDTLTGDEGMTGVWVYTNSTGENGVEIPKSYAPNTTEQFSAKALLGFEPEPGASLDYTITDGSGRIYLSRNHNTSNDPSRDEFEMLKDNTPTEPRIIGIDDTGDGIADIIDADGNGVLDIVIGVGCSAPYPWAGYLIVEDADGPINYFGTNMPEGMGVDSGTGLVEYNPPCSDSGQVFTPSFNIGEGSYGVIAQFRVGD